MKVSFISMFCYIKIFQEKFIKIFKVGPHCQFFIIMLASPLLEVNFALEQSLCGGSGLRLWLYSSESGGN